MIRIYTLALRLGLIVLSPYFLLRGRRYWPTLKDRFGKLTLPQLHGSIWLHAVSVGEVRAIEPLIAKLRPEFPGKIIVLSTTTPTGQQLAHRLKGLVDETFYFPFDLPAPLRRTLDRIEPELIIIAETEIWPNLLEQCAERKIPVMMINGRISDKSLSRYRLVQRWLGRLFDGYTVLGMQSALEGRRIESLGANPNKIRIFGNLKFDIRFFDRAMEVGLSRFLRRWNLLWIAASTMPGEDEFVLDAFLKLRQVRPELKLLLAPRHPERVGGVLDLAQARGFKASRRTALNADADIMILDTVGELAATFEYASVVFVGGSLVPSGGHNILEPARYSKPILFGPHMENFRDIARLFLDAKGALQIPNASALAPMVDCILSDSAIADSLGRNAHRVLEANAGATDRVLDFIRTNIFTGTAVYDRRL